MPPSSVVSLRPRGTRREPSTPHAPSTWQILRCIDHGVLGLVGGGKYVISAPSSYAYGDGYAVEVDLELVSFEKFKQNFEIDKVGDAIAAQVALTVH